MLRITTLMCVSICSLCSTVHAQPIFESDRARLIASDGGALDSFGWEMALAGEKLVVSAAFDDNAAGVNAGAVYVYDFDTGVELFKLGSDDLGAGHVFGNSIDADGNLVVVGAGGAGAAYVFDLTTGTQLFRLEPGSAPPSGSLFGASVAIEGNTIAVGAAGTFSTGAVYLFDAQTGEQTDRIDPTDTQTQQAFGGSVEISGDHLAVGAPSAGATNGGAVELFSLASGLSTGIYQEPGVFFDDYGLYIGLSGDTMCVGGRRTSVGGERAWFLYDLTSGAKIADLTAPSMYVPALGTRTDVLVEDGLVYVGSPQMALGPRLGDQGGVLVFDARNGAFVQAMISATEEATGPADSLGVAIVKRGGMIAVADELEDGVVADSGGVYFFEAQADRVLRQPRTIGVSEGELASFEFALAYPDGSETYQWRFGGLDIAGATMPVLEFGASIAGEGVYDCVLTGSFGTLISASVELFVRGGGNECLADLNGDGVLNFFDVSAFLAAYSAGCP